MTYLDKKIWILVFIALLSCLVLSIGRDLQNLEDNYSCDLRKRIVGARYQSEGLSPYFHKWKQGEREEYCIPYEAGSSLKQNVVTLPPSYLWILQPLSALKFHDIEIIWLALQYVLLSFIFLAFFRYAKSLPAQILLTLLFCLFIFTKGWIYNISIGQSYMIFPAMWVSGYLLNANKKENYLFAGIILSLCCWMRPICLLMAIPFFIMNKNRSFIKGFVLMSSICLLQVALFKQGGQWMDFFQASALWEDYYDKLMTGAGQHFQMLPVPNNIEGQSDFSIINLPQYNANVPSMIKAIFHVGISSVYYLVTLILILVTGSWMLYKKRNILNQNALWLSAFLAYYLAELFTAVPKPSYYFVELIFPVFIIAANLPAQKTKFICGLLLTGMFLSTLWIKVIPMQLLIAEYISITGILLALIVEIQNHHKKLKAHIFLPDNALLMASSITRSA